MRYLIFINLLFLFSCSQPTPSQLYTGKYNTSVGLNRSDVRRRLENLKKHWLINGCECFGLVLLNKNDGSFPGKPVKCEILSIYPGRVKCKALENVTLVDKGVGFKLGIEKGQIWWEENADLFKTRKDAVKFLDNKGWLWVE